MVPQVVEEVQEQQITIPVTTEGLQQQITIPVTTDTSLESHQITDAVKTDPGAPHHITIPISAEGISQHELPTTVQLSDGSQAGALSEGTLHTYEQDAEGNLRQVYIQTNDGVSHYLSRPLYLTNLSNLPT